MISAVCTRSATFCLALRVSTTKVVKTSLPCRNGPSMFRNFVADARIGAHDLASALNDSHSLVVAGNEAGTALAIHSMISIHNGGGKVLWSMVQEGRGGYPVSHVASVCRLRLLLVIIKT